MLQKIKRSDIEKVDFYITPNNKRESIYTVFERMKPDYIINAVLYDMKTGTNITNVEDENKTQGYMFSQNGIGIEGASNLIWVDRQTAIKSSAIRDFMAGAPTLVVDGKKLLDSGKDTSSVFNTKHVRSYIGFDDNYLYLGATDREKMTCSTLADLCLKANMKYAINLDGGGSSICGKMDYDTGKIEIINNPTENRPNPSWILVYLKPEAKPAPKGKIKVIVNGELKIVTGFIQDGRTYIQIRELGDITNAYTLGFADGYPIITTRR